MRLLILGGTVFVGRHLVADALAHGHEVTLFNRGKHPGELPPAVEVLHGDRDGGLDVLRGRRWDAVVDTCGYVPRIVRASATLLQDAVELYVFVSSVSVYRDLSAPGADESAPVGTLEDETVEEVTGESYGPLKALCERAAEDALPGRVLTVRPGLIVGPHDPTDRFTYWPVRAARGGEMLAPAPPEAPVQFIDVRDLSLWMLRMVERGATGTFNATGPEAPLTFAAMVEACREAAGHAAQPVWVDAEFLLEQGVAPWSELPLWVPWSDETMRGLCAVDVSRAVAAGLTFRPAVETARDTLSWHQQRSMPHEWQAGLPAEREAAVLRAWHARRA